jgi:hypothetical protein
MMTAHDRAREGWEEELDGTGDQQLFCLVFDFLTIFVGDV